MTVKATEIMFLAGIFLLFFGFWLVFGVGWSCIASGSVLLLAAFRNAAEREKGDK